MEETSQAQEDSQAISFCYPSTPSQREHVSKRSPSSLCSTHAPTRPALHSPPLPKRPRHDVANTTVLPLAPASTPAAVPLSRSRRPPRSASPPAINVEFEIDPVVNAGVLFSFDAAP